MTRLALIEKKVAELEQNAVIVTDATDVTEINGKAASARQLNPTIEGTIANDLEKIKINSVGFIDIENVLASINASGYSYTATENCFVSGFIESSGTYSAAVYINNKQIVYIYDDKNSEVIQSACFLPLAKGQTFSTKSEGRYRLTVYGLK